MMKFNDMYKFFHEFRGLLLIIAIAVIMFCTFKCYAYVFDCEGPSGEALQAEKNHRNEQNKEAYDRCRERDRENERNGRDRSDNDSDPRDRERANTWMIENMAQK